MNEKKLEKILITMGDASGIGPEISIKTVMSEKVRKKCLPIIIGNFEVLKNSIPVDMLKNFTWNIVDEKIEKLNIVDAKNCINLINIDFEKNYKLKIGTPDKTTGKYSFLYLKKAVELINNSFAKKIVTAPISKKAWQEAGILYPAHTEALAGLTNTKKYAMIFANKKVKVVLATRHIPVKDIAKNFDKKNLEDAIDIGLKFLDMLDIKKKRIGICSLNPHAGENGYNGDEEIKIIKPVLDYDKYKNINFSGPISGDAIFHKAMIDEIDLVISAYHDQGIFPLKVMDYYGCVNITIGLPFIRVSPGHGTACDIAGKNIANPAAMIEAILWSLKLKN